MGSHNTRLVQRQKFRKKFVKWGMSEKDIDACMDNIRERQELKVSGELPIDAPVCNLAVYKKYMEKNKPGPNDMSAAIYKLGEEYEAPNDKGFAPSRVDSVFTGVGRATGQTAKVVKRRKTITRYEYDGGT